MSFDQKTITEQEAAILAARQSRVGQYLENEGKRAMREFYDGIPLNRPPQKPVKALKAQKE